MNMQQHFRHGFELWRIALAAVLFSGAVLYLRGWIRVRKFDLCAATFMNAASVLCGLSLIWLAMGSWLATFDHQLLTAHMVQHLVLMTLAPAAIWLGSPLQILKGVRGQLAKDSWRFPTSRVIRRILHTIGSPAVCWLGGTGTLIAWHVPSLFTLGMRSEALHGIEQATFLFAGFLFWSPVIRPWSSTTNSSGWMIPLYLFLGTLPCDILSAFLVFCDRIVYRVYEASSLAHGLSPLEDQQCAGALMWTSVTVVYLVAGTIYSERLLMHSRTRQSQISVPNTNA